MAHNVSLPIAFEFRPLQAHWALSANPSSLESESRETDNLLQPTIANRQTKKVADAWIMRDEFFHLKHGDTDALLEFLNRWGWWRECGLADLPKLRWERPVSAAAIWDKQERFRRALSEPVAAWLYKRLDSERQIEDQDHNMLLRTHLFPEYPHHRVVVRACEPALLMTITIDLLTGVEFRLCKRKDCNTPFKFTDPRKQYCQQYCAHIESVRAKRTGRKQKGVNHAKG